MDRSVALSRPECLELLAAGQLGRVAFTECALPAIRPVHYALVGNSILLRTEGHALARHLDGQVVAFEVDDVDQRTGIGWSVVATGTAHRLGSDADLARRESGALVARCRDEPAARVVIVPGRLTGHRVRSASGAA